MGNADEVGGATGRIYKVLWPPKPRLAIVEMAFVSGLQLWGKIKDPGGSGLQVTGMSSLSRLWGGAVLL